METTSDAYIEASIRRAVPGNVSEAVHTIGWQRKADGICIVALLDHPLDENSFELLQVLETQVMADMSETFNVSLKIILLPIQLVSENAWSIIYQRDGHNP
jgi:hypothetical protein